VQIAKTSPRRSKRVVLLDGMRKELKAEASGAAAAPAAVVVEAPKLEGGALTAGKHPLAP